MNRFKVTTKVVFSSGEGILLLKNSDSSNSVWDLPGGTLEKGEQIIDCVTREIYEELKVEIDSNKLQLFGNYVLNRELKDDYVILVYKYDGEVSNIELSSEHTDYVYVNNDNIDNYKENTVIFEIVSDIL